MFRQRQPPRLDDRQSRKSRARQGDHSPQAFGGARFGRRDQPEMIRQHDQHAAKADHDRHPARNMHFFAQAQRRDQGDENRRGVEIGGGVGERQQRQAQKIGKHARRPRQPAPEMPERPPRRQMAGKAAIGPEPNPQHHQCESRTEKHDFGHRTDRRGGAHPDRHSGKGQGRERFEQNSGEHLATKSSIVIGTQQFGATTFRE